MIVKNKKKIQVIKNFLDKSLHTQIKDTISGSNFPFYYINNVTSPNDKIDDFYFTHNFFDNNNQSSTYFNEILLPILYRIKFKTLIRAKCNLYTRKEKPIQHSFHTDYDYPHKTLLYSINTNNGYTMFKSGEKIQSIENQLIMFDGLLEHCSVSQTDKKTRLNINVNILT